VVLKPPLWFILPP